MSYVTFETAKRLKDAGFPNPEPYMMRLFFHQNGREWLILLQDNRCLCGANGRTEKVMKYKKEHIELYCYFAATATDILKELTSDDFFWSVFYDPYIEKFYTHKTNNRGNTVSLTSHKNPAEAAAQAWLSIHEKIETA